uniref:Serum response factor n=1 Tax=Scleropages formosus TaxID=113540 RepID=A0A8C9SY37_SCLFO
MLPSRSGSAPAGNGSSSSGRDSAAHGSSLQLLGSGVPHGLTRAGLADKRAALGRPKDGSGMLGGTGTGAASRGGARPSTGAGGVLPASLRYDVERENAARACSGSEPDSDSAEDDELPGSATDSQRGVKRERAEMEAAAAGQEQAGGPAGGYGMTPGGVTGAKPGKKTRGRVKIKMEFIDNKLRRYTTFSKRKTGIMKKAYELSTLTGTQVLLLVASETGHVYTFATRKLQPMITSETGKALIQTCLNSPDSPPRSDPSTDQRMSATGFEETDLTYQVSESDSCGESKDTLKPAFTVASLPGTTSAQSTAPTSSTTMQVSSGPSFPITNYLAPVSAGGSTNSIAGANGTVLKTSGTSAGVMQLPGALTFMSGTPLPPGTPTIPLSQLQQHSLTIQGQQGQTITATPAPAQQGQQAVFRFPAAVSLTGGAMPQQLQAIQVHPTTQQSSTASSSSPEVSQVSTSSTMSLPASIVTSSVPTSVAGHMIYPSPHTVMYASTPTLTDGSLTVLNAFPQGPSAMQVSAQGQDTGPVPHVFLTAPVSAVQIHPVWQDLFQTFTQLAHGFLQINV